MRVRASSVNGADVAIAGDRSSVLLYIGTRRRGAAIHHPFSAAAARYGASVAIPTDSPEQAYRDLTDPIAVSAPPLPWE